MEMSIIFILGPLPVCIIFGLLPVDTQDYMASTTSFKAHGLDTFELSVDSVNLPGFPLKAQGNTVMDFYHKFLKVTMILMLGTELLQVVGVHVEVVCQGGRRRRGCQLAPAARTTGGP